MHVNSDLDNKREALDFLAERLTAAELEKVAEILTTDQIPLSVSVETEVGP